MLADELTAVGKELFSSFLLSHFVVPEACELNFHSNSRADGLCAEIEGCVAGDNLCVCESTDVTHLCFLSCELTCFNHFVELETCGNTCKVTALVNGCESVVVVSKVFRVSHCACSVAELYVRIFLCGLNHILLVAEAVCENDIAAAVCKVNSCFVAFVALGNVNLFNNLNAELCTSFSCSLDEVEVVG